MVVDMRNIELQIDLVHLIDQKDILVGPEYWLIITNKIIVSTLYAVLSRELITSID